MVEKAYRSQLTRSRPNRARVPAYASFVMGCLVDLIGIEPMTSSMPWKRAPSCATGPLLGRTLSILADCSTFVNVTGNSGVVQFDCCA